MNKLFTKIVGTCLGLAMAVGTGVAVAAGVKEAMPVYAASNTVKYTIASTSSVTATGTAPTGSSASFTSTGGDSGRQLTYGKAMTLTLTGYDGVTITGLKISAKSNTSKGKASLDFKSGSNSICSISDSAFNTSAWYGSWSTSYVDITWPSTNHTLTERTVGTSESVTFNITNHGTSNSTNSLYCQWIEITYSASSSKTVESLTVLDESANELSDGDEVNATLAADTHSASAEITAEVGYSGGDTDGSVDISSSPSAGFSYSTDDDSTYTLTFTADGDYDVTIAAHEDDTVAMTVTYHVSGVVALIWEKVTSVSQLKAGKEIIIGNTDGSYVMAPYVSGNNCPNVTSTPDEDGNLPQADIGSGFAVLTLGGSSGAWTLTDQNDMVYFGYSGQNYLKASADATDTWSIAIDSTSHEATITSAASSRWIAQNTSTQAFATYANNNQWEVAIYMLPSTDPAIEVTVTGSTSLSVGGTATLAVTKINGASGTVQWTRSNSNVTLSANSGDSITVTGALDGSSTVTASLTGCDDVETEFTVTKALSSIAITTAPTKTTYSEGESFSTTGMVVTATFDDGSTDASPEYTYSPNGALTPSDTVITISYTYAGVTKTTTQAITVNAKTVSGIAVKTMPIKSKYHSGDEFDSTGLVITVTYSDATTADLSTGFTLSPSTYTFTDADETTGSKTFTVSYSGKSTTFDVTVAGISGPIESGRYYIMNSAKTHGLNAVAATGSSPTALDLSVANNAMTAFDFELVADNEYEISVTISDTKYYLICTTTAASGSNTSIRVNTTECTWIMDDDGVETDGAYHLGQEKSSTTTRYLSCYSTTDWRGYINTSNGDPEIQFVAEGSYAEAIANSLMNDITCNNGVTAPSTSSWSTIASNYSAITIAYEKALLVDGTANESSENVIEQALARYDYIVAKYGTSSYSNFLGRTISPISSSRIALSNVIGNNGTTVSIIVVVSLVSLTAIGGYFFIRKRKED